MTGRRKTAVLISGRGSNMRSLISAAMEPDYPADIGLVVSNRPDAAGLATAESLGIETAIVDHQRYDGDRDAFERDVNTLLQSANIEFVALAGFMRLLTPYLVEKWHGRMINIHPALLPSFKGLNTHERALDEGVKIHGATVHFVSADMDDGPIIAQGAVPVLHDDTPESLGERVLAVEHLLYPKALALLASGSIQVKNRTVVFSGGSVAVDQDSSLLVP